jgi:hypothetical protein
MSTVSRLTALSAILASFGMLLVPGRSSTAQAPARSSSTAKPPPSSSAQPGDALSGFAILGGPAVTCTRSTTAGDVGVGSTAAFTNTGCTISGTIHAGDAAAAQAYTAYVTAYDAIAATACTGAPLTGTLAGRTLAPGVYCVSAEAKTGVLTLNGPATASWTFKIMDGAHTGALTGTNFSVVMAGGGVACNVTWWSEAAATLTDSDLKGSILSGAGATLTRGSLVGRAMAKAGVTLTDVVSLSGC